MGEKLSHYLPVDRPKAKVEIREDLAPVVERIGEILPPEVLWELFSSDPNQTNGVVVFPWCRVDSAVINTKNQVGLLIKNADTYSKTELDKWYKRANRNAFKALIWVEIGFNGLKNLAESRASVNWTVDVGHAADDEERAAIIMSEGRETFKECLKSFVSYRSSAGITDDYFSQFGVEYLLDEFK